MACGRWGGAGPVGPAVLCALLPYNRLDQRLPSSRFPLRSASHNRFEHSLGVAHLAHRFASQLWSAQRSEMEAVDRRDLRLVELAGARADRSRPCRPYVPLYCHRCCCGSPRHAPVRSRGHGWTTDGMAWQRQHAAGSGSLGYLLCARRPACLLILPCFRRAVPRPGSRPLQPRLRPGVPASQGNHRLVGSTPRSTSGSAPDCSSPFPSVLS